MLTQFHQKVLLLVNIPHRKKNAKNLYVSFSCFIHKKNQFPQNKENRTVKMQNKEVFNFHQPINVSSQKHKETPGTLKHNDCQIFSIWKNWQQMRLFMKHMFSITSKILCHIFRMQQQWQQLSIVGLLCRVQTEI